MNNLRDIIFIFTSVFFMACKGSSDNVSTGTETRNDSSASYIDQRLASYETVRLTANLGQLSEKEKQIIPLLIQAAQIMDDLFWQQAYGNKDSLLNAVSDTKLQDFIRINYGPWDRLKNDTPFVAGVGLKPAGANFYPADMTKEEFEQASINDKKGQYTIIRRDS